VKGELQAAVDRALDQGSVAALAVLAFLVYILAGPDVVASRNWAMFILTTAVAVAIGLLPLAAILVRSRHASNDPASERHPSGRN